MKDYAKERANLIERHYEQMRECLSFLVREQTRKLKLPPDWWQYPEQVLKETRAKEEALYKRATYQD